MSSLMTQHLKAELAFKKIITQDPQLRKILENLEKIANLDFHILLNGETGTGKSLFAEFIHFISSRQHHPFVIYNCGSGPVNLFESTLFGHRKGAFTTALTDQKGLVESAHTGTLFLDEINSLDPENQVKLNKFLETSEFRRLGETRVQRVDLRVILATNQPLFQEVKKGNFREDLYYRITEYVVSVPPLRERKADIPLLMNHFLDLYKTKFNKSNLQFTDVAYQKAKNYPWPGNVRELENAVTQCVIDATTDFISDNCIQLHSEKTPSHNPDDYYSIPLKEAKEKIVDDFEIDYIIHHLKKNNGNVEACARQCRKHHSAMWALLKKHHINPAEYRY